MTVIQWNETLIQKLIRLWKEGATARTIAKILGTTHNAVTSKARRLDLNKRGSPIMSAKEMKDKFADALADGATVADAGRSIGVGTTKAKEIFAEIRRDLGAQAV